MPAGNLDTGCVANTPILGVECTGADFGLLQYESIATDFNTRVVWPVNLTYWGSNLTTQTSAFREYQYNLTVPLNRRVSRFNSLVRLSKTYNVSFTNRPPTDLKFQLQKRSLNGTASDWVSVRIWYPVASSVSVYVNNTVPVNPIIASSNEDVTNRTATCGANKYFSANNTIAFMVNGLANCQVRITVTSNVQVKTVLNIDPEQFYANGGITSFLAKMAAFLKIPVSRLRVNGVTKGSTIVDFVIVP